MLFSNKALIGIVVARVDDLLFAGDRRAHAALLNLKPA